MESVTKKVTDVANLYETLKHLKKSYKFVDIDIYIFKEVDYIKLHLLNTRYIDINFDEENKDMIDLYLNDNNNEMRFALPLYQYTFTDENWIKFHAEDQAYNVNFEFYN